MNLVGIIFLVLAIVLFFHAVSNLAAPTSGWALLGGFILLVLAWWFFTNATT